MAGVIICLMYIFAYGIKAFLEQPESVNRLEVGKNFLLSLVGNYVGAGLVIGLFYAYLNDHRP